MRIRRMFIVVFICALLLMFPLPAAGEQMSTPPDSRSSPVEEWSQTFGGSSNDYGYSVAVTSDGGYIIAGYTESYGAGGYDVWLIKTGADGDEEWNQTFGGLSDDFGYSVAQTSDGGYIIAGDTLSYGAGGYDVWLIKTDADGNKEWDKTFGGSSIDCSESIAKTSDGGYIIAGETLSYGSGDFDFWLVKTDADGSKEWDKAFGGSLSEHGYSVAVTSDGGYIVTGRTQSYGSGGFDAWLVKAGDSDTTVTPGDGNGDGSVNALDITKVERVIVGLDADTPGADANSDGNINAMDITKIELIIAGLD
jgi:predicted secreted protein